MCLRSSPSARLIAQTLTHYARCMCTCTRGGRPYALIEDVVVHTNHRGNGVGKAIMGATLARAWRAGCYKVMLMTGRRNKAAHAFYAACGFDRDEKAGCIARPDNA